MAGPNLVAYLRLDGVEKANAELKKLEAQGNKTGAAMSGTGGVGGGAGWAQSAYMGLQKLAIGWAAVTYAIKPAVEWMLKAAEAARQDEASIVRRNVALRNAQGFTDNLTKRLDAQADMYSKVYGVADDYTREIQTQFAAIGANAKSVEMLTTAALALSKVTGQDAATSAVKLTKFLEGQTNTIKGTTIAVQANATAHERWQAVMEQSVVGLDMMNASLATGEGASNRVKTAWGEFVEAVGRGIQTDAAIGNVNALADAINSVTDAINANMGAWSANALLAGASALPFPFNAPFIMSEENAYKVDQQRNAAVKSNRDNATNQGILSMMRGDPVFNKKPPVKKPRGGGGGKKPKPPFHGHIAGFREGVGGGLTWDEAAARRLQAMTDYSWSQYGQYIDPTALDPFIAAAQFRFRGRAHEMETGGISSLRARVAWRENIGARYEVTGALLKQRAEEEEAYRKAHPTTRAMLGGAFGQQGLAQVLGGFMQGGVGGGLSSAFSLAGGALGGPIGGLLGGLIGGGLGKLFGGHKKQQRDGQTNATAFIFQSPQLEDIRVAILRLAPSLRQSGAGINSTVRNIALQAAR